MNLLIEGVLDDAVGRKLVIEAGGFPGISFGKQGCGYIRKKIMGFNASAGEVPLLTLVDFADTRADCPPTAAREWLPAPKPMMVFRLVVFEIESWLLADRAGIADFLGVSLAIVPLDPESVKDPKKQLVSLATRSPRRRLRDALVPAARTTAATGPLYTSELARFVASDWNPEAAAKISDSLCRCRKRLRSIVKGAAVKHPATGLRKEK